MATKTTTKTAPVAAPVAGDDSALITVQAELITDAQETVKRGTYADTVKAIKAGMAADTRKLKTLDAARDALLDIRVFIVRDTAHAATFPESHATAGPTAGKPSQSVVATAIGMDRNAFAPYWKAATELFTLFPELKDNAATAITDAEREHVASFWKAEALRAKARRDAAKAKADKPKSGPVETIAQGDGGTEDAAGGVGTVGRTADVTVDTVMAAMAVLARQLETFTAEQGFTVEQGMQLTEALDTASALVHAATAS